MNTEDRSDILRDLHALMEACGPESNAHDKAITLITACIINGLTTRARIIGALKCLGFDQGHIALTLKHGAGPNPKSHRWHVDADGTYRLHDD